MSKTARQLRAMRKWLGLSQNDLAIKCRVSKYKVQSVEAGHKSPAKRDIEEYLDKQYSSGAYVDYGHIFHLSPDQLEERNTSITRVFETGKRYRFFPKSCKSARANAKSGSDKEDYIFSGKGWEMDCTFEFVKDEGIHHCFKAVPGGWSRTYTDAQLVDKKIEEVEEHNG